MEADIERKKLANIDLFSDSRMLELGKFADSIIEKYKGKVSSCVLKRNADSKERSIEVKFMIDDLNNIVTNQDVDDIRAGSSEIAYEKTLPLEVDVLLASSFWEGFNSRDEVALNLLRHGIVLKDNGFLRPLQELLVTGKTRPSKESTRVYFVKAERSLKTSAQKVNKAVLDLYWCVTDTAHAAVMVAGLTPPSPSHLAEAVNTELVKRNLVHKRCGEIVDSFYNIAKKIMHKEVFEISGRDFDRYLDDADFFLKEMDDFVRTHVDK